MKKLFAKLINFIRRNFLVVLISLVLFFILVDVLITVLNQPKQNSNSSTITTSNVLLDEGDGGELKKLNLFTELKYLFPMSTSNFDADYVAYSPGDKLIILVNLKNAQGKKEFQDIMSRYSYKDNEVEISYNEP